MDPTYDVWRKRLEGCEMRMWRRMEKISWTERVTNEEIQARVNEQWRLIHSIWKRKVRCIGHILRGTCWTTGRYHRKKIRRKKIERQEESHGVGRHPARKEQPSNEERNAEKKRLEKTDFPESVNFRECNKQLMKKNAVTLTFTIESLESSFAFTCAFCFVELSVFCAFYFVYSATCNEKYNIQKPEEFPRNYKSALGSEHSRQLLSPALQTRAEVHRLSLQKPYPSGHLLQAAPFWNGGLPYMLPLKIVDEG